MHLLSENARWITESDFVSADGTISRAKGETVIRVGEATIANHSYVQIDGRTISNDYAITIADGKRHPFRSQNPALGTQSGYFDIDRNVICSRFEIKNTALNGFEVIVRNGDRCTAHGALYERGELINTWRAVLTKCAA
jgi:hypothetical protein